MKAVIFKFVIPILILGVGVAGALFLKSKAKKAEYTEPTARVVAVETTQVSSQTLPITIYATGSVVPARKITLTPEVSGRISYISDNLIPGSRFKKGEVVARIDKRDYKLAVQQQIGQVEQAKLNLQLENSRGSIAKQEWELLSAQTGGNQSASGLALRKPQYQEAQQRTASAKSVLQRAKLNLKKTVLKVPFDAMVIQKNVDVGQLVGPSSPVATLMGTDELWVNVSLPIEQLSQVKIPGINSETGSEVTVIQNVGRAKSIKRKGQIIRLQGQLDQRNRTAVVLVSIPRPFDLQEAELPLLSGAYVEVVIHGDPVEQVVKIERNALRDGSYVWLVAKDNTLKKSDVAVGWKERDHVVLTHGIQDGDEVVTSPLSFPLEGMKVKRMVKSVTLKATVHKLPSIKKRDSKTDQSEDIQNAQGTKGQSTEKQSANMLSTMASSKAASTGSPSSIGPAAGVKKEAEKK